MRGCKGCESHGGIRALARQRKVSAERKNRGVQGGQGCGGRRPIAASASLDLMRLPIYRRPMTGRGCGWRGRGGRPRGCRWCGKFNLSKIFSFEFKPPGGASFGTIAQRCVNQALARRCAAPATIGLAFARSLVVANDERLKSRR